MSTSSMKAGDLVRLKRNREIFYDWKEFPPNHGFGFYLETRRGGFSSPRCRVRDDDVCILVECDDVKACICTPRNQVGFIRRDFIEAIHENR